jgi:hypothetical protein
MCKKKLAFPMEMGIMGAHKRNEVPCRRFGNLEERGARLSPFAEPQPGEAYGKYGKPGLFWGKMGEFWAASERQNHRPGTEQAA